jgi:hypothetical protein
MTSENVFVAAGTAIARTLFVSNPTNPRAAVKVLVQELTGIPGEIKPGGRTTTLFINPDPSAPLNPLRPGNVDQTSEAFDISRFEVHDIEISSAPKQDINFPAVKNQGPQDEVTGWPKTDWEAPRWENPRWENPRWENPRWENPRWENPRWENPRWENPRWENEGWENATITDADVDGGSYRHVRAAYTNIGNTTSSYDVRVVVTGADARLQYQLIAYKLYTTTGEDACEHSLVGNTQVLVNIPNYDPSASNLNSPPPESVQNTTIHLHPGETVYTVLVAFDPTTPEFIDSRLPVGNVLFAARPHAVNTADADAGVTTPPLFFNDEPFLTFEDQPVDTAANEDIGWEDGPLDVRAQNAQGTPIPNLAVTMSIGSNPSGGTLSGTLTRVTNALGIATFDDLSINNAGADYTLVASAPNVDTATSVSFDIIQSFVVTNTNDSGAGSLRAAITNANANAGLNVITFNIDGGGVHTISPTTPLPTITDRVQIDGFTQTDAVPGSPLIVLDGDPGIGLGVSGLTLGAGSDSSLVQGLVINGFPGPGITIVSNGNVIRANYIGTNADGTTAAPNAQGIVIGSTATKNLIGGDVFADRNVIGGNAEWGIGIEGDDNLIRGNVIGVDPDPEFGIGVANGSGGTNDAGIMLLAGAANNNISGTDAATAPNIVINNNGKGVALASGAGSGNRIRFNRIDGNTGLGIDLNNDGITLNDPGSIEGPPFPPDSDTGPNDLQNTATLSTATVQLNGSLSISGSFFSTPDTTFQVDYYVSPVCSIGVPTDRDGRNWFASGGHTTDSAGNAAISGFVALPAGVSLGNFITVTVTNPGGSTSEFSNCVPVVLFVE